MKITKPAMSGTLESSDVMIYIFPNDGGIEIELNSTVDMYYHNDMIHVIEDTLRESGVSEAKVTAVDHGALDCTIRARLAAAIKRSLKEEQV